MGNATNPEQWAAQERLRFIEKCAFWRGTVNRLDLQTVFGVSQAQTSADLQKYLELNPGSLIYSLNRKRYEGAPVMKCKLHEPNLEDALALFLSAQDVPSGFARRTAIGAALSSESVAGVELPPRDASDGTHRAVFYATLHKLRVRIHYLSLSGKKNGWRWIAPHAFGHDGYRWHVRAWCEENKDYRDFVLSRIKSADWPTESASPESKDKDWNTWLRLVLVPNKNLSADQQQALSTDYGMRGGKLILPVRKAMLDYTLAHLRLPASNGRNVPPHLTVDKIIQ